MRSDVKSLYMAAESISSAEGNVVAHSALPDVTLAYQWLGARLEENPRRGPVSRLHVRHVRGRGKSARGRAPLFQQKSYA
jgi:hypothetical protein